MLPVTPFPSVVPSVKSLIHNAFVEDFTGGGTLFPQYMASNSEYCDFPSLI